jgi:hypothetical protein
VVDGGVLGGGAFAQHHEGLRHLRAALGRRQTGRSRR